MGRAIKSRTVSSVLFAAMIVGAAGFAAVMADADAEWPVISFSRKAAGLNRPTSITNAGDGSNRLFVTEQKGRIIVLKDFAPQKTPFLDITRRASCCGERGLLSVVFPKNYSRKGHFYVNYTASNPNRKVFCRLDHFFFPLIFFSTST